MRRIIACLLYAILVSVIFMPYETQAYTTNQRSRAIHVIYDDSGSMIRDGNNQYVDRWGQAKYALEVFAAMLEEEDSMQVYYMSDYDTSAGGRVDAPARVAISGTESSDSRVSKIHSTVTQAANTPFDPVVKAYADLQSSNADEKWLVVLTDGEFNRLNGVSDSNIDVDGLLSQYVAGGDIKAILLSMGEAAPIIQGNQEKGIFFEQANNSNEILGKITTICNQIFNRNKLQFNNEAMQEFSFDVSMMEILVFAQGNDVKVNGIQGDNTYVPDSTVEVRYSETATTNTNYDLSQIQVSRDLTGVVASFNDVQKGSYRLDVTGAQNIEIYYKPNVTIGISLSQNGTEVQSQNFVEGDYQIRFGITDETGAFFESSLFGEVDYEATLTTDENIQSINSGDTINLKRGDYTINVLSHFLDINTAENTISGRILAAATPLTVEVAIPNDDFTITNLKDSGAFIITVTHDGELLTEAEWMGMPLPEITTNANINIIDIKRGKDISTFEFFIRRMEGDLTQTTAGDIAINVSAELVFDEQLCTGESDISINILMPVATPLDIEILTPVDDLTVTRLNESPPFIMTIKTNEGILTKEQWENMPLPQITTDANVEISGLKRGEDISTFTFNLKQMDGDRFTTSTGDIAIKAFVELEINEIMSVGETDSSVVITDDISFTERFINWVEKYGRRTLIITLLVLFVLGYTPILKKYLPKALKKRPEIKCTPISPIHKPQTLNGKYKKELLYTFLPFFAERGIIKFTPSGVSGASSLKILGARRGMMRVINIKDYAGKKHIMFDGISIEKDEQMPKYRYMSPRTLISVNTKDMVYSCDPSVQ